MSSCTAVRARACVLLLLVVCVFSLYTPTRVLTHKQTVPCFSRQHTQRSREAACRRGRQVHVLLAPGEVPPFSDSTRFSEHFIPRVYKSNEQQAEFEKQMKISAKLRGKLGVSPYDSWMTVETAYFDMYRKLDKNDEIGAMKLQGAYEDIIDFEWNSLVSRFDGKELPEGVQITSPSTWDRQSVILEKIISDFKSVGRTTDREKNRARFARMLRPPSYFKQIPGPEYTKKVGMVFAVLLYLTIPLPNLSAGWSAIAGLMSASFMITPRSETLGALELSIPEEHQPPPNKVTTRAYMTTAAVLGLFSAGGWYFGGLLQKTIPRLTRVSHPVIASCTSILLSALSALFINTHEYDIDLFTDEEIPMEEIDDVWSPSTDDPEDSDPFGDKRGKNKPNDDTTGAKDKGKKKRKPRKDDYDGEHDDDDDDGYDKDDDDGYDKDDDDGHDDDDVGDEDY